MGNRFHHPTPDAGRRERSCAEALLRSVSGRDVRAQQPMVERARRAVRIADQSRREQGQRGRRSSGIVLFVLGAVILVLGPALWIGIDDMIGGAHLADLWTQLVLLSTMLLLAMVAALAAGWGTRTNREEFRADRRKLLH